MSETHPGDRALSHALSRLRNIYSPLERETAKLLAAYIKSHGKELRIRNNEKKLDFYMRFMQVFSGVKWALVRRKIAKMFTDADEKAAESVNDWMEPAFVDGMNNAAFAMSLAGIETWPVTATVIARMVAQKIITLRKRKVKRSKDQTYNEHQVQSAIHAAIYHGIAADALAEYVAEKYTRAREREARAAAQASVYSASDEGAYYAGLEAENAGVKVEKTWLGIIDAKIRPSHSHLHNTTIPMDALFHGYHGTLRYPHDPEAPPAEIYNCRCRMVVHLKGKRVEDYERNYILPTQTTAYKKWRDEQIRKAGTEVELMKLHKKLIRG